MSDHWPDEKQEFVASVGRQASPSLQSLKQRLMQSLLHWATDTDLGKQVILQSKEVVPVVESAMRSSPTLVSGTFGESCCSDSSCASVRSSVRLCKLVSGCSWTWGDTIKPCSGTLMHFAASVMWVSDPKGLADAIGSHSAVIPKSEVFSELASWIGPALSNSSPWPSCTAVWCSILKFESNVARAWRVLSDLSIDSSLPVVPPAKGTNSWTRSAPCSILHRGAADQH